MIDIENPQQLFVFYDPVASINSLPMDPSNYLFIYKIKPQI